MEKQKNQQGARPCTNYSIGSSNNPGLVLFTFQNAHSDDLLGAVPALSLNVSQRSWRQPVKNAVGLICNH